MISKLAKKRFLTSLATLLGVLGCSVTEIKASSAAGTGEFSIARQQGAARPMGTLDAGIAMVGGEDAVGMNPAGLTRLEGRSSFSATLKQDMLGTQSGRATLAFGDSLWQTALALFFQDEGEISLRDEDGNGIGNARPLFVSPAFSMARKVNETWRAGFTLKAYQQYLGDFETAQSAMGIGADLGVQIQPAIRSLGFGFSVLDIGRKFRGHSSETQSDGWTASRIKAGLFFVPRRLTKMRVFADVESQGDANPALNAALEYVLSPAFTLRGGARVNWDEMVWLFEDASGSTNGPFYGGEARRLALGATMAWDNFALDYAVVWWSALGFQHGLTMRRGI